jgi:hypothetical protein
MYFYLLKKLQLTNMSFNKIFNSLQLADDSSWPGHGIHGSKKLRLENSSRRSESRYFPH